MFDKISQLEQRIQEDKLLLNEIIKESEINNSEVLKEKIRNLQHKI